MQNIRNMVVIAHIDHGKSTLADRMLEITHTIEKRNMQEQYLDQMELERERGITIKMTPVRMLYKHSARINADSDADKRGLLYEDLTYRIRGCLFNVYNQLGSAFKENVYGNAFEQELKKSAIPYEREKIIDIIYDGKKVGVYRPDFVIDGKLIIEFKAQPFIGKLEIKQAWHYLKGSNYRLALLVNFGPKELQIERIVYDSIRDNPRIDPRQSAQVEEEYILNLIDTPGHSDFGYEVSRALAAVEGAILLVDATQGVQAQTLYNFEMAKKAGLKIIGAVNKIDIAPAELIDSAVNDTAELLNVSRDEIFLCSGKTGQGVVELLAAVIKQVPPPQIVTPSDNADPRADLRNGSASRSASASKALVFDSQYDEHRGVVAFIRVFSGEFKINQNYYLIATGAEAKTKDLGYLRPNFQTSPEIKTGEIGYIATGIKDPDQLKIGDTITDVNPRSSALSPRESANLALPGYHEPKPVVYVSFYPEHAEDYDDFKKALGKLRLSDSALQFEPDKSEVLGRGFKGGFLGRLHFEIISERIEREFHIPIISSFPTVAYRVRIDDKQHRGITPIATQNNAEKISEDQRVDQRTSAWVLVQNPQDFPLDPVDVEEPMTKIEILTPNQYLGGILGLSNIFRISDIDHRPLGTAKMIITGKLPLADLISDFDDKLKSVSQGYGSLNYEVIGYEKAVFDKLEILVAEHIVPGLTRILPKKDIEREARVMVERLKELLPKVQFSQAIQARYRGRIIARETIAAMRKELGNFGKTGGDRTRKMKLWKKQRKGKERLQERGVQSGVRIPANVFKELLKK